jgi:DNA-directed RNA polymerase subunit beta'
LVVKALIEGGEVVEALRERILNRVMDEVLHPDTQVLVVKSPGRPDEDGIMDLVEAGIDEVNCITR